MSRQELGKVVVAGLECDPVTVALLAKYCEQRSKDWREVRFDVRGDDAPQRRSWLEALDQIVKARKRDDGLDAMLAQGAFDLVLRVEGIQRRDDGADLPRSELGDEELGTVRQQQGHRSACFTPIDAKAAAPASLNRSSSA